MTLHAHPFSPTDPVVVATNDPATEPAIASVEIRGAGLSKAFGPVQVFDDVSLVAAPGHRLGIVGENGAGKSTLLAILCGTLGRTSATSTGRPASGTCIRSSRSRRTPTWPP